MLEKSLELNIRQFKQVFHDDETFIVNRFANQYNRKIDCCIMFIEGMVNTEIINENIIQPVVQNESLKSSEYAIQVLQTQVIISNHQEKTDDTKKLTSAIIGGDTVFLLEGSNEALIISSKGWQTRALSEPESEKTVRGPREGFVESLTINLTLIRRKLVTPDLKFKYMSIGVQSHTRVCVCYLDNIVNKKILKELFKRLESIDIDGLLAAGYIQELIKDAPFSPFKTIGSTERPDVVAGKLLEGRIAVIVDGTPLVLTVPYLFSEYFQASEDYYINFYFSSISRLLRIFAFLIEISAPSVYLALVTFHQEMIPTPLLLSISAARQGVPFPTIVELLLLLIVFEMLREAGTRMPTNIGQTLSIVGALVLGQASIEAKIVSSPVVIIIALTALASLMLPKIKGASIVLRLTLLTLSAILGFYGLAFGLMGLLLHLCEIRTFGVPYMLYLTSLDPKDLKDTAIRAPWWYLKLRPRLITSVNRVRQGELWKNT